MNIIIPLAGEGKRFTNAGFPEKPFVDINGKSLIETVLSSFPQPWLEVGEFVFVTRKEYVGRLTEICKGMGIHFRMRAVKETTKGAACSVLLAKDFLNPTELEGPLIIANGDQIVKFSLLNFNTMANQLRLGGYAKDVTGVIPVFRASGIKWSYAGLDEFNRVYHVAEKEPISPWATCGIYYWSRTDAFFECAENMIHNERRVNNEYYVAPVYNEIVKYKFKDGMILALEVDSMIGLGTPEEVQNMKGRII